MGRVTVTETGDIILNFEELRKPVQVRPAMLFKESLALFIVLKPA
jgi:hypothetical protein